MIMAYWNGMTWGVSGSQIAYLDSFTTAFAIETKTNSDKEGKSPTEQTAKSLVEFNFETTYMVETGTKDIRAVISRWASLVGKSAPLIIGSQVFGPDKMQLVSTDVSNVRLTAKGVMMAATISFKFKEYSEDGESHYIAPTGSAVNIGSTENDRATKKIFSI